tara:strand:+ start:2535 stop:2711 length:177 start_codon:yes stop_codon:yes gene_type:complete
VGKSKVSMLVETKLPNIPKLPEVVERSQLHSPKIQLDFAFEVILDKLIASVKVRLGRC